MIDLATAYFPVAAGIGIAGAAPVGPINLLVIQRTLTRGRPAGLVLGAAGAAGDAIFAAVAAFGLGAVQLLISDHDSFVRIGGGLVMVCFAVLIWRSSPHLGGGDRPLSTGRLAAMVLGMTLTNPATLFFFLGSFGAVGFAEVGHGSTQRLFNSLLVVAGAFAGSMLWWVMISSAARALRDRVTDRHLRWLNRITAAALGVFGLAAIATGVTA